MSNGTGFVEISKEQYLHALRTTQATLEVLYQAIEKSQSGFPLTIDPNEIVLPQPPPPFKVFDCYFPPMVK